MQGAAVLHHALYHDVLLGIGPETVELANRAWKPETVSPSKSFCLEVMSLRCSVTAAESRLTQSCTVLVTGKAPLTLTTQCSC